jgi:thiamine pyrophosphate-dependent acetolactate synthase large subunit-like protein
MNLGSLATIGWQRPANLVVIVLDNATYATTGGQETATRHGADLEAAAGALGIRDAATVDSLAAMAAAMTRVKASPGPSMIVAKVEASMPSARPPLDCVYIKQRFMAAIGCPEAATSGAAE